MAQVKRTPKAQQDLLAHGLSLAKLAPDLVERFIDASEIAFAKLARSITPLLIQDGVMPE